MTKQIDIELIPAGIKLDRIISVMNLILHSIVLFNDLAPEFIDSFDTNVRIINNYTERVF